MDAETVMAFINADKNLYITKKWGNFRKYRILNFIFIYNVYALITSFKF